MRRILIAVVALVVVAAAVAPAFADQGGQPNEAASFGQCVSICAMFSGFSGDMNPGMHQGNSGDHHDGGCP